MKTLTIATLAVASFACYATAFAKFAHPSLQIELYEEAVQAKPTIVLVHGAFADGSCWNKVVPLLQKGGYTVTAVQNPMTSYEDDVATTRRAIDGIKGPVVLVGHSYGGAVISAAAKDAKNVKSLVYIAAFAPEEKENLGALLQKYPSMLGAALVPDSAGFLTIDPAKYHDVFTNDLPVDESKSLAAMQGPVNASTFGATYTAPAWKDVPTWYMVAQDDHAVSPDLERFFAKRMGAKTTEIKSSHVAFLSHPKEVVSMIEDAAK